MSHEQIQIEFDQLVKDCQPYPSEDEEVLPGDVERVRFKMQISTNTDGVHLFRDWIHSAHLKKARSERHKLRLRATTEKLDVEEIRCAFDEILINSNLEPYPTQKKKLKSKKIKEQKRSIKNNV